MSTARRFMVAIAAGALAGLLVLGGAGRLAMSLLALLRGARPSFSVGGTVEVLLFGALYGAIGGLAAPLAARALPRVGRWQRGAVVGVLVFGAAAATAEAARGPVSGLGGLRWPVLAAAAAVCAWYGVVLEYFRDEWVRE